MDRAVRSIGFHVAGGVCFRPVALIIFAVLFHFQSWSQSQTKSHLVDSRITWLGQEISESLVTIRYELPFNGMVEIRVFDASGQKIWQNQYVNYFGENKIVLKRSKFKAGATYEYALNYKMDEVRHTLLIPAGGASGDDLP